MNNDRLIPQEGLHNLVTQSILINGNEIPREYQVLSIRVLKEANKIPFARLMILDGDPSSEDFEISNSETFLPGAEIEILVGHDGLNNTVFKGIITRHSVKIRENGNGFLEVEARDAAVKMTIGRKSQYFIEQSDSDIITQIAETYGLSLEIESTTLTHKELVQFYTSDWDFIISRAEMNGRLVFAENGSLKVKAPNSNEESVLELIYGSTILEFEAAADARYQYQTVTASSWDYANQSLLEAEGNSSLTTPGNLTNDNLAGVIGLEEFQLKHSGQVIDQELQAWANACLLKSQLSKVIGRVKFEGFAQVIPGSVITLKGVGQRFNGNAYVTAVSHEIYEGKWHMSAQFGLSPHWFYEDKSLQDSDASGLLPGINGLQIGVVSQLEGDPDGENRILVKLPIVSTEAEGIWSRVATLDAGDQRGSFFLPEIGDEVVVGFLNGDPRDAIVLGMLNSSNKPAPLDAADDNHIKGFVTRSDMKVLFDDENSIITVETPAGNKLIISDGEGSITLEDQNSNTYVMDSSGIALNSAGDIVLEAGGKIELKASQDLIGEGLNVSLAAQAQLSAEGSAGAEMTSSAIVKIQGSLVQIN